MLQFPASRREDSRGIQLRGGMEYLDKESVEVSDGSLPLATRYIACSSIACSSSIQSHSLSNANFTPVEPISWVHTLHKGPGASPGSRVLGWAPRGVRVELRTI